MLLIMKILPSGGDRMNYIEKSQDFYNTTATNLNIATI